MLFFCAKTKVVIRQSFLLTLQTEFRKIIDQQVLGQEHRTDHSGGSRSFFGRCPKKRTGVADLGGDASDRMVRRYQQLGRVLHAQERNQFAPPPQDGSYQRIYVNGELDATSVEWKFGIEDGGSILHLGRVENTKGGWYAGLMDDIWIFDGALPQNEIQKLMNGNAPTLASETKQQPRTSITGNNSMHQTNRFRITLSALLAAACASTVLSPSQGYSQELITKSLVLDLNADKGLAIEDSDKVTTWKNQAPDPKAVDFKSTEEGRTKTIISQTETGTGRPTLRKEASDINGHNSLIFELDELINDNDEAFHGMMTGAGYTWFAVIKPNEQFSPKGKKSKYPNAFFGCLRSSSPPQNESGMYAGFWGSFYPDGRVYMGSRNGLNVKTRDQENTPEIVGPIPSVNKWHIIMGRQGSGKGEVLLELFVDDPAKAVNSGAFPVADVEPSRMAIGTERNAINHQGKEPFDGELARLLMYETALDQKQM